MVATSGTIYVDARLKDPRGNVITFGRLLTGVVSTFNADDFQMRTLKSVTFNPWEAQNTTTKFTFVAGSIGSQSTKEYRRGFYVITGSIGSLDTIDNYIRVRSARVSSLGTLTSRAKGAPGAQGTVALYIGTQPGSIRANYVAVGR